MNYRYRSSTEDNIENAIALIGIVLVLTLVAGWGTHIIVCIQTIVGGEAIAVAHGLLLLVGVFFPPVGVVHGIGIWFGAW